MAGNSWYNTGFQGMAAEQARQDSMYGPSRFWLPAGKQRDLVFVDDDPMCIHEHNPRMGGNFRNWITCQQGVYDDVVCCQKLGMNSRYYCGYLTVVDCSEWVDQKGNSHQYELRLLQAKMKTLKKFRRKKDDRGSLIGSLYRATREDDKSPSCGDEFEFIRAVDLDKLFDYANYKGKKLADLWDGAENEPEKMAYVQRTFQIKPNEEGKLPRIIPSFNYFELLRPKDPKEMRTYLGAVEADPGGGGNRKRGSASGGMEEDDVPF